MIRTILIVVCGAFFVMAETVSLSGIVTKTGDALGIAGVKVSLAKLPALSATTSADGSFILMGTTSVQSQTKKNMSMQLTLKDNALIFSPTFQNVTGSMEIFSSDGKRSALTRFSDCKAGKSIALPGFNSGINIVRLTLNGESYTRTVVCLGNALFLKNEIPGKNNAGDFTLAKQIAAAAVDTLVAVKSGYTSKKVAISSYNKTGIAIMLDTAGGNPGVCDRIILQAAVDSYIEAQKAGDPSKMSLAEKVNWIENLASTTMDKSICKTAMKIAFHRDFFDVDSCRIFSEVIVTDAGHPYVIGMRLRVSEGKISEVDAVVTDKGDWLFDATKYLTKSKGETWDTLPVAKRSTRQYLINSANAYLQLFDKPYKDTVPWGTPCNRLEGGNNYTDPVCSSGIPQDSQKITNRDFVVDQSMGSVDVYCRFFFSPATGYPDSHLFRLVDGKLRYVHTLTVMK
jgi:hypothetical protein